MRLFTAIDIPQTLHLALAALKDEALTGARWTTPQQWHITLHFIGEVDHPDAIAEAVQRFKADDFLMHLRSVGTFPARGKPRVLWAGVEAPPELLSLHRELGAALAQTSFHPEQRPYTPHLTLARFKTATPARAELQRYQQQHSDFATEAFQAGAVTLYESQLSPAGARYLTRAQCPLQR